MFSSLIAYQIERECVNHNGHQSKYYVTYQLPIENAGNRIHFVHKTSQSFRNNSRRVQSVFHNAALIVFEYCGPDGASRTLYGRQGK